MTTPHEGDPETPRGNSARGERGGRRGLGVFFCVVLGLAVHAGALDTQYMGITSSLDKEVYLSGDTIRINCSLGASGRPSLASSSRDLYLYHGSSNSTILPWSSVHERLRVEYPDQDSASFFISGASRKDRGAYKCCPKNFLPRDCKVALLWVYVAEPLLKPSLEGCHVIEFSHVTCTWKPPGRVQLDRAHYVQQVLQLSVDEDFSTTFSSDATRDGDVATIRDVIEPRTMASFCLRLTVDALGALEGQLQERSDVLCLSLLQIIKPSEPVIAQLDDVISWSLPDSNYRLDVPVIFRVIYRNNRTNVNTTVTTKNGSMTVDWTPHSTHDVWVEASYQVRGNRHSTTGHKTIIFAPSAPCRNPETLENSFSVLQAAPNATAGLPCAKIRVYFKPLKEIHWCSPHPPKYRIDSGCSRQIPPQDRPFAYVDAFIPMTTETVRVVAFNELGDAEDSMRGKVRITKASTEVLLWVEGYEGEALVSWSDDKSRRGYTIFYCLVHSHDPYSTCSDHIDWIQIDGSSREVNISGLLPSFRSYRFGISVKMADGNTGIKWTDKYHSLYAVPRTPKVLTVEKVGNSGRIRLLWEPLPQKPESCFILGFLVCRCLVDKGGGRRGICTDNGSCFNAQSNSSGHEFADLEKEEDYDGRKLTHMFWVSSKCRSGLSEPSFHRLQDGPGYMVIVIIVIIILMVAFSLGLGAHFIKRVKKWHKKLTSGIEIRPPDAVFISKAHNNNHKWLSSSEDPGPNYHHQTGSTTSVLAGHPFLDASSASFYSSNGHPGNGHLDDSDNALQQRRMQSFKTNYSDRSASLGSLVFSRLLNSDKQDEYCVINWDERSGCGTNNNLPTPTHDCHPGRDDDDDGGGGDKEAMTKYCKIQTGSLDSVSGGQDGHQSRDGGGDEGEISKDSPTQVKMNGQGYGAAKIADTPMNDAYVSSDVFFDNATTTMTMMYQQDDNNNMEDFDDNGDDDDDEVYRRTMDDVNGKAVDDRTSDANDGLASSGDRSRNQILPANGGVCVVPECNLFNKPFNHNHHHRRSEEPDIPTISGVPPPSEQGLEVASLPTEAPNEPYCGLGALMDDEMKYLLFGTIANTTRL